MNALVPFGSNRPLATAAWSDGSDGVVQRHEPGSVLLGYHDGWAVGRRDDRPVLVAAGGRSGKGASVVVPNLVVWPGSVVVIDPKGENAMITARRRGQGSSYCYGMGQRVWLLDPMGTVKTPDDDFVDLRGSYNPLDLINPAYPETVDQGWRIANALVGRTHAADPYWEQDGRALLRAIILHVATSKEFWASERNLVTVRRLLVEGDREAQHLALLTNEGKASSIPSPYALLFEAMQRNCAFDGVIAQAGTMLGYMEAQASKTFVGVSSMARVSTDFVDAPGVKTCLGHSDFQLSDLKTDPKGMSLFLSLPQGDFETHAGWLRMMTTLIVSEMERVRQQPACGHPVLMVLDEFASLGRMKVLEHAVAQIAGFGVKMMIVVQTLAQLKDIYKENWETFIACAGVRLFFGNDDHFTRDYISKLIGDTEVKRTTATGSTTVGRSDSLSDAFGSSRSIASSWNSSGNGGLGYGGSSTFSTSHMTTYSSGTNRSETRGFSESVHKRPLVTPDEIGRLFGNTESPALLALVSGHQPVALSRRPYFDLRWMQGLFDWHADHPRPLTLPALTTAREVERVRRAAEEAARQRRAEKKEAAVQALLATWRDQAQREKEGKRRRWERQLRIRRRIIHFAIFLVMSLIAFATVPFWLRPIIVSIRHAMMHAGH